MYFFSNVQSQRLLEIYFLNYMSDFMCVWTFEKKDMSFLQTTFRKGCEHCIHRNLNKQESLLISTLMDPLKI